MRLDWNDIRARAAKFADEWKDAHYEKGEAQTFYNEFFELFSVTRRRVASFEHGVDLPANKRGYLDLFWKGKLLIEQKSRGRDLKPARRQALDYFLGLKEHELPRYILLSDFQTFELYDLDLVPDKPIVFRLSELPDHVQDFGFVVGQERRMFKNGRSQAVRLPKEFRMPGREVRVRRLGRGVLLEPVERDRETMEAVFAEIDRHGGAEFLPEGRPAQPPMASPRRIFDDE